MPSIILPVVLCGGCGTRLWPVSRAEFPKQFINLFAGLSFFQMAAQRLSNLPDSRLAKPVVIGNEEHRFLILQQLKEINLEAEAILLEPVGRNTAPALALAGYHAEQDGDDPIMIVVPSDQMILDNSAFSKTVLEAVKLAAEDNIVLLGITPSYPEIGYGYIKTRNKKNITSFTEVEEFVEKPDLETATSYIQDGGYYWNSGIFVLKASVWRKALQRFRPDIANSVKSAWNLRTQEQKFIRPDNSFFTTTRQQGARPLDA